MVFRILFSPTSFVYAVLDSAGVQTHPSMNRVMLFHPELEGEPIWIVTEDQFDLCAEAFRIGRTD